MADTTVKKISLKNTSSSTGYDTRDIGVDAENVDMADGSTLEAKVKSIDTVISTKVDKVSGKGLSTNDYTTAEKTKLAGIASGAQVNTITGIKGNAESAYRTGQVNITPANVGAAPINHASTATTYGVASSTNYGHVKTGTGITNSDGAISVAYGSAAGTACQGNDSRLSDARTPKSHASTATTYGGGTASNYGHNKLSDTYSIITPSASSTGAATSQSPSLYALQQAYRQGILEANRNEYRDITADFDSGTFSANLSSYRPGNYIKKTYNGSTYVALLADYNTFYGPAGGEGGRYYATIQKEHWVAIVLGFANGQMNSTNTTAGGFSGSKMWAWCQGDATTAIKGAFSTDHLIPHKLLLSNGTYNASDTVNRGFSWDWTSNEEYACIMSEPQIYGCCPAGLGWQDVGEAHKQLSIFKNESYMSVLDHNLGQSNYGSFLYRNCWLRALGSVNPSAGFCGAFDGSCAGSGWGASDSNGRFPITVIC